jgi:hypothetical protein
MMNGEESEWSINSQQFMRTRRHRRKTVNWDRLRKTLVGMYFRKLWTTLRRSHKHAAVEPLSETNAVLLPDRPRPVTQVPLARDMRFNRNGKSGY